MVGFPLLLIPLAIYNIIVFLMPDVSFTDPLVKLTLMSGAEWTVTLSDVLLTLAILLLLAEVIKGARPGAKYLTDHLLSLIVFGAAAAEFVLWPKFATSTYFLMTALSLVDFVSGLALRTRRRAVAVAAAPAPPPKAAEKRSRRRPPSPKSIRRRQRHPRPLRPRRYRRQHLSPNQCCRITPNRSRYSPPSSPRRLRSCPRRPRRKRLPWKPRHRRPRHRRSRHRDCSRARVAAAGYAGQASALIPVRVKKRVKTKLDGLPGPEARAAAPELAGAIGRLRIRKRCPPQAAGLRCLVGGRNQLSDEGWIGPRRSSAATSARTGLPAPARCAPARQG